MDEQHSAGHQVPKVFENSKEIRIDRLPSETRPYLAMVRAGSLPRSTFFNAPLPKGRIFDVGLNYYAPPHAEDLGFSEADVVFTGGLSKFHGAKVFLETTGYVERYRGVLFLDDDLDLLFELDEFFKFCETSGLHLAQASLSNAPDSFFTWHITRNHPGLIMRTTNFVEVMAPFFAREFLKEMLHSFDLSISSLGLDVYWGHHLGEKYNAAIIDQFQMKHKKPIDAVSGPWYSYLRSVGIDAYEEMRKIFDKIGRDSYDMHPMQIVYNVEQIRRPG